MSSSLESTPQAPLSPEDSVHSQLQPHEQAGGGGERTHRSHEGTRRRKGSRSIEVTPYTTYCECDLPAMSGSSLLACLQRIDVQSLAM